MIFNMTGGGSGGTGGGATLVVSCPANVTVTVSKDDKSYTKNSGNLGSATFKGLATGEWTVTIEGNEQTATKNITITADYAITMAFFAAYINITYPANSTCVVQSSGGVTVASDTNNTSSTKTWQAIVNATGTYTITATATDGSGESKPTTVSITQEAQSESVALSYDLYLYHEGNECTPVTGGWVKKPYSNGTGTLSKGSSYMTLNCPQGQPTLAIGLGNGGLSLSTINKYKTLSARLRCTKKYGTYTSLRLCITNTYSYGESGIDDTIVAQSTIGNPVIGEDLQVDVDITNVSYGHVAILVLSGAFEVSEVWLSK